MAVKKYRSRFTIKFNENDPAHKEVIQLLERQGAHSKANFIANAILHYIKCPETPDIFVLNHVERDVIEKVVIELLEQQNTKIQKPSGPIQITRQGHSDKETEVDKEMVSVIQDTLFAFRNS